MTHNDQLQEAVWRDSPLQWALDHDLWKLPVQPEEFHREWLKLAADHFWRSKREPVAKHLLLRAPKDFAKTTCFAFISPLWAICVGGNPDIRIVLASETVPQAAKRVVACRNELASNKKLKDRYGTFRPHRSAGLKWTDTEFVIAQRQNTSLLDGTMRAAGTGSAIEGGRADLVIVDDILSPANQATPGRRAKVRQWFSQDLRGCCEPHTPIIGVGTRKHHADLMSEYCLKPNYYAPEQWMEADYTDGDGKFCSRWPALWPPEALLALQTENPTAYARDKRNRPMAEEDSPFPWDWLERAKDPDLVLGPAREKGLTLVCVGEGWDVAGVEDPVHARETDSDYYACMTVGMTDKGQVVLCDIWRDRGLSPSKWLAQVQNQYARHAPDIVVVETNATQRFMRAYAEEGSLLPLKRHDRKASQNLLIKNREAALSILFENGRFVLPYGDDYSRGLVDKLCFELNQWGVADHDDMAKALDMICQHLKHQSSGSSVVAWGSPRTIQPTTSQGGSSASQSPVRFSS